MTQFIQAIYEHGVFRPLEPVPCAEQEQVSLAVSRAVDATEKAAAAAESAAISLAIASLRQEMDALPDRAPIDGLGGADHDLILYGKSE